MQEDSCPKCKSSKITLVAASYPKSFECLKCGHMFLESKPALIDE